MTDSCSNSNNVQINVWHFLRYTIHHLIDKLLSYAPEIKHIFPVTLTSLLCHSSHNTPFSMKMVYFFYFIFHSTFPFFSSRSFTFRTRTKTVLYKLQYWYDLWSASSIIYFAKVNGKNIHKIIWFPFKNIYTEKKKKNMQYFEILEIIKCSLKAFIRAKLLQKAYFYW